VHAQQPGDGEAGQHEDLSDHSGLLGPDAIDHHPGDEAQQGAGQHRHGDHETLLGRVEPEIPGDGHAQRPEQHPDHEAEIEIEEGGEQGRRVA